MGTVDDYLASLAEPRRTQVGALFAIATETAAAHGGDVVQGESYGMPALLYRGKGLFTAQLTAKHVGVYPFSANAVGHVVQEFSAGAHAKGALRYPGEIPEPEIRSVVQFRLREIDARLDSR